MYLLDCKVICALYVLPLVVLLSVVYWNTLFFSYNNLQKSVLHYLLLLLLLLLLLYINNLFRTFKEKVRKNTAYPNKHKIIMNNINS